ncbi:MAG: hypothetical protein AAGC93_14900 [Cyanobacteria bacterium P01_F01_bin.53]
MANMSYQPPVSALLTYGDCQEIDKQFKDPERDRLMEEVMSAEGKIDRAKLSQIKVVPRTERWPNYVEEVGLTLEHVPELIRMMEDEVLNEAMDDSLEVWAPVHAWRSLGQLRAEEAVDSLLTTLFRYRDADWEREEIPCVLGLIGESAIAPLTTYLAKRRHKEWTRIAATESIERIAKANPELKDRCLEVLAHQLKDYARGPRSLNGFLVSSLVELEGTDYAELMGEAYGAGRVDETICGTWPHVQIDMGLAKEEDFTSEELEIPTPEWAKFLGQRREVKPSAFELGLPTKRPDDELSIVFGDGKLPFGKHKATKNKKGFGGGFGGKAKASKKGKKK